MFSKFLNTPFLFLLSFVFLIFPHVPFISSILLYFHQVSFYAPFTFLLWSFLFPNVHICLLLFSFPVNVLYFSFTCPLHSFDRLLFLLFFQCYLHVPFLYIPFTFITGDSFLEANKSCNERAVVKRNMYCIVSLGIFNRRALHFLNRMFKKIHRALCRGHALTHTTRHDVRYILSLYT